VINDALMRQTFEQKVNDLIGETPDAFVERHQAQLARRHHALALPAAGSRRMTPADIYRERIESVVLVGIFYHCRSKTCNRLHSNVSTGVVIREDGVLLTNYHVVEIKQPRFMAMAVMTVDGRVFLVDEVLAADPIHDVAAIRLRDACGLAAAPVSRDEPVGNPVSVISHPRRDFFTLTSGYVSRYSMGERTNVVMNITADYAVGSSGGPVFNNRGDVVGLVSSTTSIAAGNVRLNQGTKGGVLDRLFGWRPVSRHEMVAHCDEEGPPGGDHEPGGESPPQADKKKMPISDRSPQRRSRTVNIPVNHQMTIKNAVPSRAILALLSGTGDDLGE